MVSAASTSAASGWRSASAISSGSVGIGKKIDSEAVIRAERDWRDRAVRPVDQPLAQVMQHEAQREPTRRSRATVGRDWRNPRRRATATATTSAAPHPLPSGETPPDANWSSGEQLAVVPMRPCAALAAAGWAIRAGAWGRLHRTRAILDTPQGLPQLREHPSPRPLSRETSQPPRDRPAAMPRAGAWGRSSPPQKESPPQRKKVRGWVGGPSGPAGYPRVSGKPVRALLRDGGVGGAAPRRRGRGLG